MYIIRIINVFAVVLLIGCATNRNIATHTEDEFYSYTSGTGESIWNFGEDDDLDSKKYAVVKTFFATDRNLTGKIKPSEVFGSEIGNDKLTYGVCRVSIPKIHHIGEIELPSIEKFEIRDDPAKHIVLLSTGIRQADTFFSELGEKLKKSEESSAFVFVHGYNVTFENAAKRTAQIAYDLQFDGVPVFFSWPSKGSVTLYGKDEETVELSKPHLKSFLIDFFSHSTAENVYLIAHSMGNRALTSTITSLFKEKPELKNRLKEIILTAPDIDAEVFKKEIAPAITAIGHPVTLYASSDDLALFASKFVHDGKPRAGDSGEGLVIYPGIETIDATNVDTGFLKHSYYGESRSVISDMYYLINGHLRPDKRFGLLSVDSNSGKYWMFKP